MEKTLVICGSYAVQALEKANIDWGRTVVLEFDALLPERPKHLGAHIVSEPYYWPKDLSAKLQAHVETILSDFLDDLGVIKAEIDTSREFRKACLGIAGKRLLIPHISCLHRAAELEDQGPWSRVIISPGQGVSIKAWRAFAGKINCPIEVLPMDQKRPPFLWMLKRRWARWWCRRASLFTTKEKVSSESILPIADCSDSILCADPGLLPVLGTQAKSQGWRIAPEFSQIDQSRIDELKVLYKEWFEEWWRIWVQKKPGVADLLSGYDMVRELGIWHCEHVYPYHALMLKEASEHLDMYRPRAVIVSAMHGRKQLMWALAARRKSIKVGLYTLDDPVDANLSFEPDMAFCDDARHVECCQKAGLPDSKIIRVKPHRRNESKFVGNEGFRFNKSKVIVLADTFYSGHDFISLSGLSARAIKLFLDAARQLPDFDFAIKFHPLRERPDEFWHYIGFHHLEHWFREKTAHQLNLPSNVRFLTPELKLSDYLKTHVDVLINIESYAIFEAYELDVPVIGLKPVGLPLNCFSNLNLSGPLKIAKTQNELIHLIRCCIEDAKLVEVINKQQKLFIQDFYFPNAVSLLDAVKEWLIESNL